MAPNFKFGVFYFGEEKENKNSYAKNILMIGGDIGMIRVRFRTIIIPRGDTGFISFPNVGPTWDGDVAVFSLLDKMTRKTVLEKIVDASDESLFFYFNTEDTKDLEAIAHLKSLITIYEGKMNTNYFGKKSKYNNELSSSWLKNASDVQFNQLKKNLENFFRKVCKAKQNEILWSCYKKFVPNLKGKGYTKAWLEYNARATNNYKDRTALAYVCNAYMNPNEVQFFSSYDIQIDQDGLALNTMLQWIWRSAIRDDKSIQIYIPSQRMRELLKQYLDGEK